MGAVRCVTDALHMLGASHECLDADALVRIAVLPERARMLARSIRAHGIPCVVLATCHRLEVYWEGAPRDAMLVREVLARVGRVSPRDVWEQRDGEDALRHMIAVASGARSQRPGEPEILGQLRTAWQTAQADHTSSLLLDWHLQTAIAASRYVRRRIGATPPQTIGEATTALMASSLQQRVVRAESGDRLRVLLLGAGAVARSTAAAVRAACGRELPESLVLHVANRTEVNAARLADETGALVSPWASWRDELPAADIVVCSARAAHPLLTADDAALVAYVRRQPALWIDLGAPPNIANDVHAPGIVRRTTHDLAGVAPDTSLRRMLDDGVDVEVRRFRALHERKQAQVIASGARLAPAAQFAPV